MIPISICMIAKNEEKNIHNCLAPLKKLGFELIIVDTGSTDHTKTLATQYTNHVYDYQWDKNFSAARNFSIAKASYDWILVVDFDEYLRESDIESLISSTYSHQKKIGTITRLNPCKLISGQFSIMTEQVARLFNRNYNHYQGIVHEQVFPIDGTEPIYFPSAISFYHHGYESESSLAEKADRNLSLLLIALKSNPADPYLLFQIGKCYQIKKKYDLACHYFNTGLSYDLNPNLTYVQDMIESYGYCLLELKEYQTALGLSNVYDLFAYQADFVFLMGLIYMNNALFEEAIREFQKATSLKTYRTEGINTYMPNYNIGVIYECTGRISDAINYYQKCHGYPPALNRLKILGIPLP